MSAPLGTDVEIVHDGELCVAQIEGLTDRGVEFVDAYLPSGEFGDAAQITAVDAGRIIVPLVEVEAVEADCAKRRLRVAKRSLR